MLDCNSIICIYRCCVYLDRGTFFYLYLVTLTVSSILVYCNQTCINTMVLKAVSKLLS